MVNPPVVRERLPPWKPRAHHRTKEPDIAALGVTLGAADVHETDEGRDMLPALICFGVWVLGRRPSRGLRRQEIAEVVANDAGLFGDHDVGRDPAAGFNARRA